MRRSCAAWRPLEDPLGKANRRAREARRPGVRARPHVAEAVTRLKARGLVSPYLRTFVVARINPLRWIKDNPPPLEEVLETMRGRAAKFNVDKIRQEDLATAGGAPDDD